MTNQERRQHSKAFVTGCDKNTFWQLKWFITNLRKHTKLPLEFYDFGLTPDQVISLQSWKFPNVTYHNPGTAARGWFNKPATIMRALFVGWTSVCWLDTDAEVIGEVDSIFQYNPFRSSTIGMVYDHPWMKRRGGHWFNSGVVVAFWSPPALLKDWVDGCRNPTERGDQEVLYKMLQTDPLKRLSITALPHKYNVLRLDVQDNNVPRDARIMHWTGAKGNEIIRGKIKQ